MTSIHEPCELCALHCKYLQWNYSGKGTHVKSVHFTVKYLPCTVQCRSYSKKKPVNQLYIYSTVLGGAIKCKQYSEITVESGTHVKSVKITLNIFAVYVFLLPLDLKTIHSIRVGLLRDF